MDFSLVMQVAFRVVRQQVHKEAEENAMFLRISAVSVSPPPDVGGPQNNHHTL
jgi:hypothetical protein